MTPVTGPFIVQLDKPREVKWTMYAKVLVDKRAADLKRAGDLYAVYLILWASLVDRDHPFAEPEDIAQYVATSQQVKEVSKTLIAMKKAATEPETKNERGSTPGHSRSSSS